MHVHQTLQNNNKQTIVNVRKLISIYDITKFNQTKFLIIEIRYYVINSKSWICLRFTNQMKIDDHWNRFKYNRFTNNNS